MIYTLTLNSAIDMNISTNVLCPSNVNRTKEVVYSPNGKGVNVSLVMSHYNVENISLLVAGGFSGQYITEELNKMNQKNYPFWVNEPTRINIFIDDSLHEYKVVSKGSFVDENTQVNIINYIENLNDMDFLIVSGSLPPGISESFYFKISEVCKRKKTKLIFDISSPVLKDLLCQKPYLIKPNDEELELIFGHKLNNEYDILKSIEYLHSMGAENILLTMGNKGLYFSDSRKVFYCTAPKIKLVSSACAGDSCLGSFIAGLVSNLDLKENLKRASATGANVAESMGIGSLNKVKDYTQQIQVKEVLL